MIATQLSTLGAGFSNAALGSQAVFRAALDALAHPGRMTEVSHDAQVPAQGHGAAAAVLLALLDPDCTLWLSPTLRAGEAAAWLRFHTGCVLVDEPGAAQFAWVARGDALPPLSAFSAGSDAYPEQAATVLLDVDALHAPPLPHTDAPAWTLRGPGIDGSTQLQVASAHAQSLPTQWRANHALFPRGIDLYFATATQIAGLPRTTHIDPEH